MGRLQSEAALSLEPAPPELRLCWGHGQGGQEGIIWNSSAPGAPEAALASYSQVSPQEGQSAARVEGAHTGVLEQDSELYRGEREVSNRIRCQGQGRSEMGGAGLASMETKMRWVEAASTGMAQMRWAGPASVVGARVRWARVCFHGCCRD